MFAGKEVNNFPLAGPDETRKPVFRKATNSPTANRCDCARSPACFIVSVARLPGEASSLGCARSARLPATKHSRRARRISGMEASSVRSSASSSLLGDPISRGELSIINEDPTTRRAWADSGVNDGFLQSFRRSSGPNRAFRPYRCESCGPQPFARDHRADHVSLPLQVSPRRRNPRSGTRHTGGR